MSTQHTGDGPPGDDNYYDPVGEENNRASGSGTNINAAAWDPENIGIGSWHWRRGELCLLCLFCLPAQWCMQSPIESSCLHSGRRMQPPGFVWRRR